MNEKNTVDVLIITTYTIYILFWTVLTMGFPIYFTFIGRISGWWILGGLIVYESHISPESWRKLIKWEKKVDKAEYSIE